MTPIFDPTLALTLLTHPFHVALIAVTFGALVRVGIDASRLVLPVITAGCQLGELASAAVEKPSCGNEIRFQP